MRPFEVHKYLEANGFHFHREGSKHKIYRCGQKQITVPRHRTIRFSTTRIIEKFVREAQAEMQSVVRGRVDSAVRQAVEDNELVVPDSACEDVAGEENCTTLPPGLYEVYRDFIHFCEENSHKAGDLNIRDILIQNGHQLPDWNTLVSAARANQDVAVLFDLQDAIDSMKITSFQLKTAIAEIEQQTAPEKKEFKVQEKPQEDFQAAKIVAQNDQLFSQNQPFARPRTGAVIAPAPRVEQSASPAASTFSPRQLAFVEVLQILGRLQPADARLVAQQAVSFVEMG
jgi:predicted RNA binding protein YcfA (HicA-like mRNA interferase family)